MTERQYWLDLEFRICRELAGMSDDRVRGLWCDGLTPSGYWLDGAEPRIVGKAWIVSGQNPREWDFTLILPGPVESVEAIDWAGLLPADGVTRWLSLNVAIETLELEPAVAVCERAARQTPRVH